jgi:hypothetical protein
MEQWRQWTLAMEAWRRLGGSVDKRTQIRIPLTRSRLRIHIRVKSRIRIRIRVKEGDGSGSTSKLGGCGTQPTRKDRIFSRRANIFARPA